MSFPLSHPRLIAIDPVAEAFSDRYVFLVNRHSGERVKWFLKSRFPRSYLGLKKSYYRFLRNQAIDTEAELALLASAKIEE